MHNFAFCKFCIVDITTKNFDKKKLFSAKKFKISVKKWLLAKIINRPKNLYLQQQKNLPILILSSYPYTNFTHKPIFRKYIINDKSHTIQFSYFFFSQIYCHLPLSINILYIFHFFFFIFQNFLKLNFFIFRQRIIIRLLNIHFILFQINFFFIYIIY